MSEIKVPNFSVAATGDKRVTLSERPGAFVLYFYPRDATPGCTIEGDEFTNAHAEFQKLGVEIFGASRDSLAAHEKFKTKQGFAFDLLSDGDERLSTHFRVVKSKVMYGKSVRGIERSTFVFDESHQLVREWRGVKVAGHVAEVVAFVRSLRAVT